MIRVLYLLIFGFEICLAFRSTVNSDFWYTPTVPPTPTEGVPWPYPQNLFLGAPNLTVDPNSLDMTSSGQCQTIQEALDRYRGILLTERGKPWKKQDRSKRPNQTDTDTNLTQLQVLLDGPCESYPYLGMQENYLLSIFENGTALLQAPSVWGLLRGLETFSQLTFVKQENILKIRTALVEDWPRFSHRGLLLDTSRHYVPTGLIKKNLDLMAHAKYNVFHWHIVDDQSFPYVSDMYPKLSEKGAYTQKHIYTKKDIDDIVEYARLRGIRVMPEFDSPGHSKSWGLGYPELMTRCYIQGRYTDEYGVIDPSNENSYKFMLNLITEVLQRFPDQYIHLGGDEVFFDCWESNMRIEELMRQLHIVPSNVSRLEDYYIKRLLGLVEQARPNASYMVWQEVFDNGVPVKSDTVVHVWMGNTQAEIDAELDKVTKRNLRTVLSSCWYLNYIKYGPNWEEYYACDPQHFAGTPEQKKLVIGGETCMWGEWVDGTNVLQYLWPRASVVAERLWSDASVKDPALAKPRLEEHRCRLVRRGYPATPINGPGHCDIEWQG